MIPRTNERLGSRATCYLLLAVLLAGPAAEVAAAAQNREALYTSCRKKVFAKYGRRDPVLHKRYLRAQFALLETERCVANSGKLN